MSAKWPPAASMALVATGGAIGATVRVAMASWFPVADGAYPWTTFVENVVGAFALALVLAVLAERAVVGQTVRLLVGTGALGAFTTYSTLAIELDRLTAAGHLGTAAGYSVASLAGGVAAALLGLRLGRQLAGRARRSNGGVS